MSIRPREWVTSKGDKRKAWVVDYVDVSGRRRTPQFGLKKEAEEFAARAFYEVRQGVHTAASQSITVAEASKNYLNSVRALDREPTTIAAYEQHIRLHILPICGGVKLSQLTAPIVKGYLSSWLASLSHPMAVRVFRTFKAIITEAQEAGHVAQNAALAVRVPKKPRGRAKKAPPTKEELRILLHYAGNDAVPMQSVLVELLIFTGLRASEIRGLVWDDLDLHGKLLHVRHRADARGLMGVPKTDAGFRTIPMSSRLVGTLKRWKVACPPHPLRLVFPSVRGKVISNNVLLNSCLSPALVAAGVTLREDDLRGKYKFHSFRHAAASLWIEQGLNPKRIQYLMGHSSIQVTFDTYGHLFEQYDANASDADAIARALSKPLSLGS